MQIKHRLLLFLGLALGPFMVGVDLLAIAIAIEPMTKALNIDIATLQWFLSAYGIGNSSFLVASGKLADMYGKKKILIVGLLIFIASSLAIALANSSLFIIFARFIQGASGGMLPVVAIATLMNIYEGHERTKWIGGIVGFAGLGMVVGPAVGGFLIHYFGWRTVFLINIPIGFIAIALVLAYLPPLPTISKSAKVDWVGILLFAITLTLFTTAISQGHYWGWLSTKTLLFFSLSLVFLLIFIFAESKVSSPLVEFSLFREKNFFGAGFAGLFLYFALTAWILVFGIYLQRVMGLTPLQAGYTFLPFGLVAFLCSLKMGTLSKKFGAKKLILFGMFFVTLSFLGLSLIPMAPHFTVLLLLFALFGFGFVFVNSNTLPAGLEFVSQEKMGLASGKSMMLRWLGGALGAAIITTIFMTHGSIKLNKLVSTHPSLMSQKNLLHDVFTGQKPLSALPQNLPGAKTVIDHANHFGLVAAMLALALLSAVTLLVALFFIHSHKEKKNGN